THPMTYADGRVSAEIEVILGGHQFLHETAYFVKDGEYWKLDQEVILAPEPEGDTAVVGVQLGAPDNEDTIVPNADSVKQSPVLIFHATNAGKVAHMLAVLKVPKGVTFDQVLKDEALQKQVEFIGSVDYVAPGGAADLALVDLPPGEYTLACFFTAPDG